jgi:hypothetical protein
MNLEEARSLLVQCQQDRVEAQLQAESAKATAESATLIIQGLIRRYPELREQATVADLEWEVTVSEGPTTAEAVLQILQVNEGQLYTVREMVNALGALDRLPQSENPANAVRTALERLRKQNLGVSKRYDRDGVIAYAFDEPEPASGGGYGFDEEPF